MSKPAVAVLVLVGILVLHLLEEIRTGFRQRFPLGEVPMSAFIALNVLVYMYCLATLVLTIREEAIAVPLEWGFAAAMLLNGGAHLAIMVVRRRYFPGGVTASLLVAGALYLMLVLTRSG